jgi:hypothetical protein
MSSTPIDEFFHDFRQEVMASAEANMDFLEAEFTQIVADELVGSGIVDGFEPCHYRPPTGGIRVDGYWFNDTSLDLFITDFSNSETLQSLTQTETRQIFKRLENFFTASATKGLHTNLEETSQGYGLARLISDTKSDFTKVNLYLISEKTLSKRLTELPDKKFDSWTFTYNIWDISRLHRLRSSRGVREELIIDFTEFLEDGLPCLPAHLKSTSYKSYLVVMPATILATLYEKYGSRLLEQNVRTFLQLRGKINKGIRATIINDPEMFFAYNNGITATAREVQTINCSGGTVITSLKDLQIVNGGQTTASLFHTHYSDKASLDNIFVQMKLSVVDEEKSEEIVPKISEYANTQNKINAADFFSNHPYHVRMEEFSRRLWAPAQQGAQRETKWFYERARGQYADAQSKMTRAEKKRFQAEYPKSQMFKKTDLAKFENVWDDKPTRVNLGAQKNFAYYAERIGGEWDRDPNRFNEFYFKRAVARAIIFRKTEKLVSAASWYVGGYRANIVAYTIALLAQVCKKKQREFDFMQVWNQQEISAATTRALEISAKAAHDVITNPTGTVSNISEWAKKDACWIRVQSKIDHVISLIPDEFFSELMSVEEVQEETREAVKTQKIYNGIEAQKAVVEIPASTWSDILEQGRDKRLYSAKEIGILQVATQIPSKIPSEKQCFVLLDILEKAKLEAIYQD